MGRNNRDREVRREYRNRKKENNYKTDLFMLDIMSEGMKNGDSRLS